MSLALPLIYATSRILSLVNRAIMIMALINVSKHIAIQMYLLKCRIIIIAHIVIVLRPILIPITMKSIEIL